MIEYYKDHKVKIEQIDRDWSEDAYSVTIDGKYIDDLECEGYKEALKGAEKFIDTQTH